jgi:outer membrane lipoprotein-sorting protein
MKLEVDEEGRAYALTLLFRDRLTQVEETEVVGLEPITLRPLWVRMNAAAAITPFQATFENYDATLGLPRDIKVATAEPKARVELHWRDRELNVTVPADNFTQLPPPGVTPTELP